MIGETHMGNAQTVSPGTALAAARKAQGLTVEQVAGRMRLSAAQVHAIEVGDFAALPGQVFARGFVRNYARLLGLDAEPLLSAMALQHPQQDSSPDGRLMREAKGVSMEPARFRVLPAFAVAVAGIIGALAFYEFVLNDGQSGRSIQSSQSTSTRLPVTNSESDSVVKPPLSAATESTAVPSNTRDEAPTPATDIAAASRGLHFLFRRESWVEVKDGLGNILFSKVNLPGTEHRVQGQPPFNIIVGNAHGVQLAYNGHPVDLAAYASDDVARLRLE
jgi:cytoskeleton protein RodZ